MARLRLPSWVRVVYSTNYTILWTLVLALLAITPGALIYSAIINTAYQYIIMVGGVYVLTALCVLFFYTSRLYSNRTVLAAVGKSWIPVEDGEVPKHVRKMIKAQLKRSAFIAVESRPRNLAEASNGLHDNYMYDRAALQGTHVGTLVMVDPLDTPWGVVKHPGWSSPSPIETALTPHVQFSRISKELPNLLEARIVSLGGARRSAVSHSSRSSQLDRSDYKASLVDVREYLVALNTDQQVLIPACAQDFIARYEHARFCGKPITEEAFVGLTTAFAGLLSGLQALEHSLGAESSPEGADDSTEDDTSYVVHAQNGSLSISSSSSATPVQAHNGRALHSPQTVMRGGVIKSIGHPDRREARTTTILKPRMSRTTSLSSTQSARSIIYQAQNKRS